MLINPVDIIFKQRIPNDFSYFVVIQKYSEGFQLLRIVLCFTICNDILKIFK